jgi:hypothetical protein
MNPGGRYGWQENARVVPVYALTQGRTHSAGYELPLETLVTSTAFGARFEATLRMEMQAIVAMSGGPISVVEIGDRLNVPIGVARVLVSDLIDAGYLTVSRPVPVDANGRPSREVLERLLEGLRAS